MKLLQDLETLALPNLFVLYHGHLENEQLNIRYSDAQFLLLTGQENRRQIVC